MKRYALYLSCFVCAVLYVNTVSSKVLTVNNNPNSPGQYTRLTDAVNVANDGDTLLIAGSNTDYESITLSKRLTLIGTGYYPRKDILLVAKTGHITLGAGSANNSQLIGLYINGNFSGSGSNLSGIELRRCYIAGQISLSNASDIIITNCFINSYVYLYTCNNVLLQNCIMENGYLTIPGPGNPSTNVLIKNNLFLSNYIGYGVYGVQFSNNIFYYRGTSSNTVSLCYSCSNVIFNNNIYFNQFANPLPIGQDNNTGVGNQNINPQFTKITLNSKDLNTLVFDDYRLKTGSPGINYGTDGKDVGIYGGTKPMDYPLSGEPPIPQIKSMTINNNVLPPGGNLNVTIKARKAN